MKLLTRNTDYAIRALCIIAQREKAVTPVSSLVKETKIPRCFLRKLLQILNQHGILESSKGKSGGFKLRKAPHTIYVLDIITIFQGKLKLNEHLFKNQICPNIERCKLKKILDRLDRFVYDQLKIVTLDMLY
ncbi:MAG: Rrf2 family transcriptional regulator [Elusimicrobia bacterium]|nr:Rrf2 family transcriptional regulator [Elusimicrobiota bacterium]